MFKPFLSESAYFFFLLLSAIKMKLVDKIMQSTYLCVNNNNGNNDFITMLSIKILLTINSLKNNYSVKTPKTISFV